ncbi:protoheme IX farnesyltransferase [Candidatus Marinamargulisbacteria bacterium SCGC AG-439-L15]|nr:protoheme IX farnesyltransferase [Candidatus Marinamargulisbacteria bacterium SCGC AG-439-L15]
MGLSKRAYLKDLYLLTKPGISRMQLITVSIGYILGGIAVFSGSVYGALLLGTFLIASGAGVLNSYYERDVDAKMERTQLRPLPDQRVNAKFAFCFGVFLSILGGFLLYLYVNLITAFLAVVTVALYVYVYTPLKKVTWLNTFVGSFPGAMPILGGWAAATGTLHLEAWILFLILFTWQHPHFYALAIMYKEDYARGGLKMLPVVEPDLKRTNRQIIIYTLLMIMCSVIPFLLRLSGMIYLIGMLIFGGVMLYYSLELSKDKTISAARKLFFSSIIYLPLWFLLILIDFYFRLK